MEARFRSVRAYRRFLDKMIQEAHAGHRPMSDVPKAATAAKAGAELFMSEQMLARHGQDQEFLHPMGDDGGLSVEDGKLHANKRVYHRTTEGPEGTTTEKFVTVDVPDVPEDMETDETISGYQAKKAIENMA